MDSYRLTDLGASGGGGYDAALLDHRRAGRTRGGDARSRRGLPRSLLPRGLSPVVKPLPADRFRVHGSNAEMRWEVMRGQGAVVPNADFFVRNNTSTPLIDAGIWSLSVFGSGLRGPVPSADPVRFSYQDLLDLPARTVVRAIECAGNGLSFFAAQQGQAVPGTPWRSARSGWRPGAASRCPSSWSGRGSPARRWASAESVLWDENGTLVAYATQMMLFTYLPD